MQVFPSSATSEGPTPDKRAQPPSVEERADAADGPHAGSASRAWPGTSSGMSDKLTRSLHHVFLLSTHSHTHTLSLITIERSEFLSVFSRGLFYLPTYTRLRFSAGDAA